eukprot:SAG31_NODE_3387_length_4330_cov_3.992437_1_plen_195_part_10
MRTEGSTGDAAKFSPTQTQQCERCCAWKRRCTHLRSCRREAQGRRCAARHLSWGAGDHRSRRTGRSRGAHNVSEVRKQCVDGVQFKSVACAAATAAAPAPPQPPPPPPITASVSLSARKEGWRAAAPVASRSQLIPINWDQLGSIGINWDQLGSIGIIRTSAEQIHQQLLRTSGADGAARRLRSAARRARRRTLE